ncbi:MAG: hypothetical protein AAGB07_05115 [Pseudomonadota bacterium]
MARYLHTFAQGIAFCGALIAHPQAVAAQDIEFDPELTLELSGFPEDPEFADQFKGFGGALIASGDVSWRNEERTLQVVFEPYLRYDFRDDERTYGDVRRGFVRYFGDGWDITVGADRVFWGVVESVNIVDVINQRDGLENPDLDEKLGQPMLRFSTQTGIGNFDLYYLPYFRERQFPGPDSRGRVPFPVNESAARFERSDEETAGDFALRYSNTFGNFDVGAAYFYGTSRQPRLDFNPVNGTFEPFYQKQQQLGLDVQFTYDAWLLKLEAAAVEIGDDEFFAAVGGFEYTLFDLGGSGRDLGLIFEYIHDGRDQIMSPATPFDDDIFLGTRLTWNDVQDTELLAGAIVDVDGGGSQFSVEFQRRIGEKNLLEVELRAVDADGDPLLEAVKSDTSLLLRWSRFF